jgi:hypothetical protein
LSLDLGEKWVALMHELLPSAEHFSLLINIENAEAARALIIGTQKAIPRESATQRLGIRDVLVPLITASDEHDGLAAEGLGLIYNWIAEERERLMETGP